MMTQITRLLLISLLVGLESAALLPSEKKILDPETQWSRGNCGSEAEQPCLKDINYFCERETNMCVPCGVYCSNDAHFQEASCEDRCPAWYIQNVLSLEPTTTELAATTTSPSPQWLGGCGPPGELPCLHDVDQFCEKETQECVSCEAYCIPGYIDQSQMCQDECPEWYSASVKTSAPRTIQVPSKPSPSSTAESSPSQTPDLSKSVTKWAETTPAENPRQGKTTTKAPTRSGNKHVTAVIIAAVAAIAVFIIGIFKFRKYCFENHRMSNKVADTPTVQTPVGTCVLLTDDNKQVVTQIDRRGSVQGWQPLVCQPMDETEKEYTKSPLTVGNRDTTTTSSSTSIDMIDGKNMRMPYTVTIKTDQTAQPPAGPFGEQPQP